MSTQTRRNSLTANLTDEQALLVQAWRADALMKMPYFTNILFSLRVVSSPGLGTFAVDNCHRLYIDFDAMAPRGPRFCSEALLHEAGHLFQDHALAAQELGITSTADHKVMNAAGDAAINDDLRDAGVAHVADFGILPYNIGAKDYQTPHHYFRLLKSMQGKPVATPAPKVRSLSITPGAVGTRTVTTTTFKVSAGPAFNNPITKVEILDGDGNPVAHQCAFNGDATFTFTLPNGAPEDYYLVTATDGVESAEGSFTVSPPVIRTSPRQIGGGWTAPYRVGVEGTFTSFDVSTTIELRDENDQVMATGNTVTQDAKRAFFDITAHVPPGIYTVVATTGSEVCAAMLPIEMPDLSVNPSSLPSGYHAPINVLLGARDFDLTTVTAWSILIATPFGNVDTGASLATSVTGGSTASMVLGTALDDGTYLVVAQSPTGHAVGTLTVGDGDGGDDEGEGSGNEGGESGGQGSGEGSGEGEDSDGDFKGCGSGAGGESAPCELDPTDDLDGTAPPVGKIEQDSIRSATAAAIQDYAAKGRGTVPGGLVELANKILAPSKTPWQAMLRSHVRRALASKMGYHDTDRSKRSRRHHGASIMTPSGRRRLIVPGYVQPIPKVLVIRDTSGSMGGEDIAACGREIEAVCRQVGIRGDDLRVMDVDAAVHQVIPYKDRKSVERVAGRGGTNMVVGINAACELKDKPTVIIVLTDGGTPWPVTAPGIPVIAAIVPQGKRNPDDDHYLGHLPDFIKGVVVDSGQK